MARKAVRLSDIAEKLGVSTVTVSNALANQRGVSEELREKIQKKNAQIQRYKGLGEMNERQLWETTMDPARRSLIQINIGEEGDVENKINILMGDDPEPRREWIENNVVFDSDDNFILEGDDEDE